MADDMGWVRRPRLRGFMRMVPLGSSRRIRAIVHLLSTQCVRKPTAAGVYAAIIVHVF
jgi:hypothetical protein